MRAFTIGATIFMLGFILILAWLLSIRHAYEDTCAELGGIAVKGHAGPLVCIDRDALIEVPK